MTPVNPPPTTAEAPPPNDSPTDRDLFAASPSAGWRQVCVALDVEPGRVPPRDSRDAARRTDKSLRYRLKHALGVTT